MRILAVSLASALALAACSGKDPYKPGTPIGTFHVEATHTMNSCGEQNVPPDPWKFDVKLSRDPGKLYWVQGGMPVSGTLDAHAHASLASSTSALIHPADAKKGLGACSLGRADVLEAFLEEVSVPLVDAGTGTEINYFKGTLQYRFAPTEGSDCADLVASGAFADLPCEIDFSLSGARAPDKK